MILVRLVFAGGPADLLEGVGALTSLTTIEAAAVPSRIDAAEIARKFRVATRHSTRVRVLRIMLPITILALIAGTVAISYFNPFRVMLAKLPLDPSKIVISGTTVTMAAPRLAGYTQDARAYDVSARAASQDLTKPDLLQLQDIEAKVQMEDKSHLEMTAASGVYNRKSELLTLTEKIRLTTTTGYEARLSEAVIDVRKGTVRSQNPVDVKLLNGTLKANRLEVDDRGEVIRFEGGVSLNFMLDSATGAQQPAKP
jgi:lipopolysaccharide export system protein LptC